ncbi:MAG TPA: hypothetical protein VFI31_04360 [Pirellulales bacterium]|nr:hypothetical protein [Pirellulales bacterium]
MNTDQTADVEALLDEVIGESRDQQEKIYVGWTPIEGVGATYSVQVGNKTFPEKPAGAQWPDRKLSEKLAERLEQEAECGRLKRLAAKATSTVYSPA